MLTQLLQTFNHFAFNHTTHIFISLLNPTELKQLLMAVAGDEKYRQLAHLVRARIVLLRLSRIDRTLYFIHFQALPREEFQNERCNLLAANCRLPSLERMIFEIESIEQRGQQMFADDYGMVQEAITQPEMPLPPIKRETIAPHCQTVYQVILACEKLNGTPESMHILTSNPETTTCYFFQLLLLQIKMVQAYLEAIIDPLEHFAELTYRFMVYRNTVLALHNLSPFPRLSKTMQLWKNALSQHYERSNGVFLELAGFSSSKTETECGFFTKELLIEQGYLNDYTQGLIDLSIDQDTVAYCGHSKQNFGMLYTHLQAKILSAIRHHIGMQQEYSAEEMQQKARDWMSIGLKPSTIRKMLELLPFDAMFEEEKNYCRQDSFIETCARINGLPEPAEFAVACN